MVGLWVQGKIQIQSSLGKTKKHREHKKNKVPLRCLARGIPKTKKHRQNQTNTKCWKNQKIKTKKHKVFKPCLADWPVSQTWFDFFFVFFFCFFFCFLVFHIFFWFLEFLLPNILKGLCFFLFSLCFFGFPRLLCFWVFFCLLYVGISHSTRSGTREGRECQTVHKRLKKLTFGEGVCFIS